jgi:hypothetical protein
MTHNQIMLNPNPAEKNQTSTGIIVRTSCQGYFGLLLMIFFVKKTMTDWLEAN